MHCLVQDMDVYLILLLFNIVLEILACMVRQEKYTKNGFERNKYVSICISYDCLRRSPKQLKIISNRA